MVSGVLHTRSMAGSSGCQGILGNQLAIVDAVSKLADWVGRLENLDGGAIAASVRASLRSVEANKAVVGRCINELMRDNNR